MKLNENFASAECPVARALGVLADKWSLLLIRDAFDGICRFSDFQKNTGVAKNILAARLKELVADGIFDVRPASDGSAYKEYVLSAKGHAVYPVIITLRQWAEAHMFAAGETHSVLIDGDSGQKLATIEVKNIDGKVINPLKNQRQRVVKRP